MKAGAPNTLVDRVLQDPDNDLIQMVCAFQETPDAVWHIDRHVLDPTEPVIVDPAFLLSACAAGLSLLRKWSSQRAVLADQGIVISEPYLIIDDEWLAAEPKAPPPHVYICITAGEEELSVGHEPDHRNKLVFPAPVAELLTENETFYRISGVFEDEPGAWLIKIKKAPVS
ncbi:hypothetical protein DC522_14385 [Microvirga sp. KLBC 81]|uniref:hypothetical protein n=1 Tax=Microvirga sp. KLBC 81 TaxID=1862707 RepID=UPI000D515CF7|nr:hypothetical protein [Microvirga sp. KLBC 81]PVE23637.1 hypothetical protein DC522_14385 [Microvirga sp. KLBC 81]